MKTSKTIKTITAMLLVLCAIMGTVITDFGVPTNVDGEKTVGVVAHAATEVKKGGFNGNDWSTPQKVYLKKWKDLRGRTKTKSYGTLKVCTFNQSGKKTSGKFTILVTTPYDKDWHETIDGKSGENIFLDFGYDEYYVQIRRRFTSSTNVAKCYWWSLDTYSNCSFNTHWI